MTTGQILFYSGAALLGLTLILLIIFLIKKPKYEPETAAYDGAVGPNGTQNFRNGYPTVRREQAQQTAPQQTASRQAVSQQTAPRQTTPQAAQQSGPVRPAMQFPTELLPDPKQDSTEPIK